MNLSQETSSARDICAIDPREEDRRHGRDELQLKRQCAPGFAPAPPHPVPPRQNHWERGLTDPRHLPRRHLPRRDLLRELQVPQLALLSMQRIAAPSPLSRTLYTCSVVK